MKHLFLPLGILLVISCTHTANYPTQISISEPKPTDSISVYQQKHPDSTSISRSVGTVGDGYLENGKLMPFSGKNYFYFDSSSYLAGRAFVNGKVKALCLDTYHALYEKDSIRDYGIMECSHKQGGKMDPHKTHQNGLSVDFMSPKVKHGKICTELDQIGLQHYFLSFDSNGFERKNPEIQLDFEAIATHLLQLNDLAEKHGLKIQKVLFKIDLLDNLFAGEQGKKLKKSGIYFAKKLSPLINELHDDHYHVDFATN